MVTLTLKNISKSFGAEQVISDVSITLTDEMRLGIVGANGAGKTTLLRIISGELGADGGTISLAPGSGAGYLAQETGGVGGSTVWETALEVFDEVFALEERMRSIERDKWRLKRAWYWRRALWTERADPVGRTALETGFGETTASKADAAASRRADEPSRF